jgi:hypothetical protein
MPHMLSMPALELRNPVALLILMKADNVAFRHSYR